jgi:wyosine [tRNA(Phe)-imidazoG37] synthetase (radical SAM superfamily)
MEKVLPHVDFVYHDIKNMDPERHKKWSGIDNKRILENLKKAYEQFRDKKFIARTPVIPGVNDSEDNIRATLAFIRPHKNVIKYELLPYHRFGQSKYGFLGQKYELEDFPALSDETLSASTSGAHVEALEDSVSALLDEAHKGHGGSPRPPASASKPTINLYNRGKQNSTDVKPRRRSSLPLALLLGRCEVWGR